MPVYAQAETMGELRRIFNYIGDKPQQGLYRPLANFIIIDGSFQVGAVNITPLEVVHGSGQVCGFRFDWGGRSVGFVPDCHSMPPTTLAALQGVDVMILDALRYKPHVAHMNVAESLQCLAQIGAPQSYLIHLCHDLDHKTLSKELPPGVAISYDGLTIKIGG